MSKENLSLEVTKLENLIESLQSNINKIQGNISEISINLQEKETKIESLTGDLAEVKTENKIKVDELENNIKNLKLQNQDFSGVIEDSIPAVVSILTNLGSGSGFIIDEKGYVVTNYHVIEGAKAASVITSDGNSHSVSIIGYDLNVDIAVLEISGSSFNKLSFGSSKNLNIGESVIAVGNPGGLDFSVTKGIVSAFREDSKGNKLVQIDVPINPGNSGGPLIDAAGKVVGVNTKKIAGFEGVGFALASSYIDDFVENIINEYEINLKN